MSQTHPTPTHHTPATTGAGRPGDFDFLAGRWTIKNQRLSTEGNSVGQWEHFDGAAHCFTVLGGLGSIEELSIPPGKPRGLGIRLLNSANGLWSDYWTSSGAGLVMPPPMLGSFNAGVGTFVSLEEREGDGTLQVRGVWDHITPTRCQWHQATSRDGGRSWQDNWHMQWARVA